MKNIQGVLIGYREIVKELTSVIASRDAHIEELKNKILLLDNLVGVQDNYISLLRKECGLEKE